ncbi:MAG: hypothetical protein GC204_15250 [Chloroflexi bacterium]|nr:hypothetical protein [Chloroflexota bacterium]
MDISLIIGVASFVGAILGAALSNLVTARNAAQERKEARRKERLERLIGLQGSLIRTRRNLQWSQSANEQSREEAYGEAYAVMLSTADPEIVEAASKIMEGAGFPNTNEKIPAIDKGIELLGKLINKTIEDK